MLSLVLLAVMLLSYSTPLFFGRETAAELTKEDGLFEMLTAVLMFAASVAFFISYLLSRSGLDLVIVKTKKNLVFLFISLFLFFGFGEEISWGQRIFHIRTPEFLERINSQQEINIHNIEVFHGLDESGQQRSFWRRMLNLDRWYSIFWLVYCVLLPLVSLVHAGARRWFEARKIPLIPFWLGAFFLANYGMSRIMMKALADRGGRAVEIKECIFGLLFLTAGLWLLPVHRTPAEESRAS